MINPPELQIPGSSESYITSSVVQCLPQSLPHQRRRRHLRRLSDGGTERKGTLGISGGCAGTGRWLHPPTLATFPLGGCAEHFCVFVSTLSWLQTVHLGICYPGGGSKLQWLTQGRQRATLLSGSGRIPWPTSEWCGKY